MGLRAAGTRRIVSLSQEKHVKPSRCCGRTVRGRPAIAGKACRAVPLPPEKRTEQAHYHGRAMPNRLIRVGRAQQAPRVCRRSASNRCTITLQYGSRAEIGAAPLLFSPVFDLRTERPPASGVFHPGLSVSPSGSRPVLPAVSRRADGGAGSAVRRRLRS